jgi:hypothetical protein
MSEAGNQTEQARTVATYVLRVLRPVGASNLSVGLNPTWIEEMEENLTDLLPGGFEAKINEWDEREDHGRDQD